MCDATDDISNGNFEKNGLKAILSSSGVNINIIKPGEAGGLVAVLLWLLCF